MRNNRMFRCLLLGLLLFACAAYQPQTRIVEVTRIIRETQMVTVEGTCIPLEVVVMTPSFPEQHVLKMSKEITYRLHEIHTFLEQEPMTQGIFYNATARSSAHGVGISIEYKDAELKTLLFELEIILPAEEQPDIQHINELFEQLAGLGPAAPFSDADPTDPEKVRLAREKFAQIEQEWQVFLDRER